MIILGIETSCDETAAALVEKRDGSISILSNVVSSQVELHSQWGGVVPNLAAREHLKNILPVIEKALEKSGKEENGIDAIAVTNGPGLIPALLIGVNTAKTLSYIWKKPLLGIHHIEGHIYANFLSYKLKDREEKQLFPLLCLVVSGGHTQLVFMKRHLSYRIIGETQDDAVGEAFDKVARILGLGYPGGPEIAASAQKNSPNSSKFNFKLPRPMITSHNFNFSFSGLKTSVLYTTKKHQEFLNDPAFVSAMSHEFQQASIDVLVAKTIAAAKKYKPKTIMLAGGVSANTELRKQLETAVKNNLKNTNYCIPDTTYSLDNAAMIAAAAHFRLETQRSKSKLINNWKNLKADANLKLK